MYECPEHGMVWANEWEIAEDGDRYVVFTCPGCGELLHEELI